MELLWQNSPHKIGILESKWLGYLLPESQLRCPPWPQVGSVLCLQITYDVGGITPFTNEEAEALEVLGLGPEKYFWS